MIWWIWTACDPQEVHVLEAWHDDIEDEGRLTSECAWTALTDNSGLGLR